MKSLNFHEIPGFRGNSVKSHDAAGGRKAEKGGGRGPPLEVGPVRRDATTLMDSYPFLEDFSILSDFRDFNTL